MTISIGFTIPSPSKPKPFPFYFKFIIINNVFKINLEILMIHTGSYPIFFIKWEAIPLVCFSFYK